MAHGHKSYVKSHWWTSWFSRWVYIYNGISIHLFLSIPASAREQICRWMEGCCSVCHRVIGFTIAFFFCRSFNIWFERTREGESSLKWASDTWGGSTTLPSGWLKNVPSFDSPSLSSLVFAQVGLPFPKHTLRAQLGPNNQSLGRKHRHCVVYDARRAGEKVRESA